MQDEMIFPKDQCEVFSTSSCFEDYSIFLDEEIFDPSYYRQALQTLRCAKEGDIVKLHINSIGGRVDSAIAIINAIKDCQAEVIGILEGQAASAASAIILSCPNINIMPHSHMMIHSTIFGGYGTAKNVMDQVQFTNRYTEQFMRDIYQGFLTDDEIEQVLNNHEIWLDSSEISERLDSLFSLREKEFALESERYEDRLKKIQEVIDSTDLSM